MNVATLIQRLHAESPTADAAEVLGTHMAAMVPQATVEATDDEGGTRTVQPPEPTEASVVPPFIAKMLCFALPLLRKVVKLNGDQSNAVDVLIALVCSQS